MARTFLVYNSHCEVIYTNTTPCAAKLHRRSGDSKTGNYVIVVTKQGYDSVQVPLSGRVNGAYYLNILCGGLGLLVDPITGAMWTLGAEQPDGLSVKDNASFFEHEGLLVHLQAPPSELPLVPLAVAPAKPVVQASK